MPIHSHWRTPFLQDRSRSFELGRAPVSTRSPATVPVRISREAIRSDIFRIPFRLNEGTKEKSVGTIFDALTKSQDSPINQ